MDSVVLMRVFVGLWRLLLKRWFLFGVFLLLMLTFAMLLSTPTSTTAATSATSDTRRLSDEQSSKLMAAGVVSLEAVGGGMLPSSFLDAIRVKKSPYEMFLDKPVINPHTYPYIINQPLACGKRTVHLVITTPSAPSNFFRRMMARKASLRNSVTRHLFFLGATTDPGIQAKVVAESARFKDIVQESYLDVYSNITLKAVQMLRWVSETCPHSKYVIRLDDDVLADVVKLVGAMTKAHARYPDFVMGSVKVGWVPCRIPKCKTTKEEYPYATLPPFALGGALGYPTTSVKRLFEASKRLKRFKLDDVYITGMCAPVVNVTLLKETEFELFQHQAW